MKKAIATLPGKPTKYTDLTPEEIIQRSLDELAHRDWVQNEKPKEEAREYLRDTDYQMARAVEDLIGFTQNGTPIPQRVLDNIQARKEVRSRL